MVYINSSRRVPFLVSIDVTDAYVKKMHLLYIRRHSVISIPQIFLTYADFIVCSSAEVDWSHATNRLTEKVCS